jgi:transposase-like protein
VKRREKYGKAVVEKLEVVREVDKNERSVSEIAQAYGIPLSALSKYV